MTDNEYKILLMEKQLRVEDGPEYYSEKYWWYKPRKNLTRSYVKYSKKYYMKYWDIL